MRRWHGRSGFAVVASLASVLVACGGAGDDGTAGPSEVSSAADTSVAPSSVVSGGAEPATLAYDDVIEPGAMQTARAIVDRLGPDAAFAAVVLALDAGYEVDQIAEHVSVLTVDGVIPDVVPAGVAAGVFTTADRAGEDAASGAPLGFRGVAAPSEPTPGAFLDTLSDKASRGAILTGPPAQHVDDAGDVAAFIGALLYLKDIGYSFDQIVEGLYFGEVHLTYVDWEEEDDNECILLVERDGTVTLPAGSPAEGNIWANDCATGIRARTTTRLIIDGEVVNANFPDDNTEPTSGEGESEATPGPPGQAVQPSLTVDDVEVELVGCPDPNFPNVCEYRVITTLDYVTPVVPSTITCKGGLFASEDRSVADQSGTVDVAVVFEVRDGGEGGLTATCSLASAGTETFPPVSVEAVGETPDPD